MAEHTEVAKVQDPIYAMLAKYKPAIASVLPKHITPERALRLGHSVINRNPRLRQCSPASLINGMIEISMLGLDLGRTAHLVPFKREAVVITDYKGMIELAHRSGQINSFPFKSVYENDTFDYQEGTDRWIKHKPAKDKRGKLVAAYAVANFKHGGFDFEVVLPVDIEAIKKVAPGARSNDSPWNNPDQEWSMWCKSAVRRLSKRIPQSPELARAMELEDIVEAGLRQNLDHVMDAEFTEPEQEPEQGQKERIEQKLDQMEQFPCPQCNFRAASERGLKKHITQSHPPKADVEPSDAPQSVSDPNEGVDTGETHSFAQIKFDEIMSTLEMSDRGFIAPWSFSKVCADFARKLGRNYIEVLGHADSTDVKDMDRAKTLMRLIEADIANEEAPAFEEEPGPRDEDEPLR